MSDDDKKTYKQITLVAVLVICAILFMFAVGTMFATYGCYELYFRPGATIPAGCQNGALTKFVLEFLGIAVGVLGAIKLLG